MPVAPKDLAVLPIDDFGAWCAAFFHPVVLLEIFLLGVCMTLAWGAVMLLRRMVGGQPRESIWFGKRGLDGVLFPLLLVVFGGITMEIGRHYIPVTFLHVAVPVALALLVIRVGVKVLRAVFVTARWARFLEHTLSWLVWVGLVLWVSGLLPMLLNELDRITWTVGSTTISVRRVLEGSLTAFAVMIVTLWLGAGIEAHLLRSATGNELSLRKALSNTVTALLLFIGLMLTLSAVGIDLTVLSVVISSLGIGIGFGLQKLAANYVSGFVILAERSMRIGDQVKVQDFEGTVTQINARYTVVRSSAGTESIVPNELLLTTRVENMSLADRMMAQSTSVVVVLDADAAQMQRILLEAASQQARVLRSPAPEVRLSRFAPYGLEFELSYWLGDPENGHQNLRSAINMAILAGLRANNISLARQ